MATKKKDEAPVAQTVAPAEFAIAHPGKAHPRRDGDARHARRPVKADGVQRMRADRAGERSALFPAGGTAFVAWLRTQGIDPNARRTEAEYQDLLQQFADRPIHGHRRAGGRPTHRRK